MSDSVNRRLCRIDEKLKEALRLAGFLVGPRQIHVDPPGFSSDIEILERKAEILEARCDLLIEQLSVFRSRLG